MKKRTQQVKHFWSMKNIYVKAILTKSLTPDFSTIAFISPYDVTRDIALYCHVICKVVQNTDRSITGDQYYLYQFTRPHMYLVNWYIYLRTSYYFLLYIIHRILLDRNTISNKIYKDCFLFLIQMYCHQCKSRVGPSSTWAVSDAHSDVQIESNSIEISLWKRGQITLPSLWTCHALKSIFVIRLSTQWRISVAISTIPITIRNSALSHTIERPSKPILIQWPKCHGTRPAHGSTPAAKQFTMTR